MDPERWLAVIGYEGVYDVSDRGRVRSVNGRLKSQTRQHDGRLAVQLWKSNHQKCAKVHRLVLLAFIGEPPLGMECCHNDGDPMNNRLENLRWDTAQANQRDRVKHGTSNRGERSAAAKLTEEQALSIKMDGRPQKEIAADFGIRPNTVSRIKSGVRWPHLSGL